MKTKNKTSLSDMFASRRNKSTQKKSPFEMHINRAKQTVLGRRLKTERGLPGISRSRAITKRKQTLLQEFRVKDKDNLFYDKRIGERNRSMTEEEKTMRRFVAEQVERHRRNKFDLNDEEVLTHRGQSIMDIEKYDMDPHSDDDLSDSEGRLDSNFTEEAHFGGGLLERKDEKTSHKDLIETLILESKKRKAEKKKMKEETMDLTEKLDAQWKDLLPLVTAAQKTEEDKEKEKGKVDDYDKLVRQMKSDRRAVAGEKLKSVEDEEREEKERLEKLERQRIQRMEDEEGRKEKNKHKSADDLDFDYLVENVGEDLEEGADKSEEDDESEDEEDEEDEEDGDDVDNEDEEEDAKEDSNENEKENKNEDENENQSESEDDLADLKESSSEDESENEENIAMETKPKEKEVDKLNNSNVTSKPKELIIITSETESPVNNVAKFKNLKKTYNIATSLEELEELFAKYDMEQKSEIINRMIKNKEKTSIYKQQCGQLFDCLLQFLDKYTEVKTEEDVKEMFEITNMISPHLYDLAHLNPEETSKLFKDNLKQKHELFEADVKKYPGMNTIIFFKIAALIYPSSDFRHPIMTPCHVFMSRILLRSQIKNRHDLTKGIFICTLFLENILLSKRFAPSVINFLRGILYASLQKDNDLVKPRAIPPFKSFGLERNFLVLENSFAKNTLELNELKMQSSDFVTCEIDDDFKLRLMATALGLLNEFTDLLQNLEASYALFTPFEQILKLDVLQKYPQEVRKLGKEIEEKLEMIMNKQLEYLTLPKKKPKALKLYEPKIEPVYEGKRNRPESKDLAERQKMAYKLKMETKNAKREIRRDNAFLTKVRINKQIKADEERKRKVKELFADAAIQQSELKKMKKK